MGTAENPRRRAVFVLRTLMVWALLFGGICGSDPEPDSDPDPSFIDTYTVPPTAPPTAPPTPAAASDCPNTAPVGLRLVTDSRAEAPYLDDIVACTEYQARSTLLINNSDAVWTISSTTRGATVENVSGNVRTTSFGAAATSVYTGGLLIPGATVRVSAPPSTVTWTLHPGLSTMWLTHDQLADMFRAYGETHLTGALSGSSLRRRAVVTCSLSGYQIAGEDGQGLSGPDPTRRLFASLGVVTAGIDCASALRQADDEMRSLGRSRVSTLSDDVARLAANADFLRAADRHLNAINRVGKALGHLVSRI